MIMQYVTSTATVGLGYAIIGALLWGLIKIEGEGTSFKFLKTVAFWFPRCISSWPSSEWMCK